MASQSLSNSTAKAWVLAWSLPWRRSQAARNAASGVANWHTMPSPSVLTTLPFDALTFFASTANRRLIAARARVSPSVS